MFTGERLKVFSMAAVFTLVLAPAGLAKSSPYPDSNLSVELQGQLSKAVKGFKQVGNGSLYYLTYATK